MDAREFWPATQSGATKGEAEVQAQKAKGKGFGRMLTNMERALNWHVMPSDCEFGFDRQDDDADLAQAILHNQLAKNVRLLWEPASATGQGIVTTEEARRLLERLRTDPAHLQQLPPVPERPVRVAVLDEGGRVVGTGTPEEIASMPVSHTGRYLRHVLTTSRRAEELGALA